MITAGRMAAVDRNAAALGVSQRQLMEASGQAVARAVRDAVGVRIRDLPITREKVADALGIE